MPHPLINACRHLAIISSLLLPIFSVAQQSTPNDAQQPEQTQLPLQDLRAFADAYNHIRTAYVEEIDDETLLKYAIKGMLAELDPHSNYLDEDSFQNLQESTRGEFGGLGLEVGMEDGFVKVISPIDDTPAQKAGIESGDLIIKLDGKAVKGMSLNDAVGAMRGKRGSSITITIVREGTTAPFDVTIVRDMIAITSVRNKILEPGYGYVRIAQFQDKTGLQFEAALKTLTENNTPLKGLVLDLRNNPGGVLSASIDVVDAVLNSGKIVYTEGRLEESYSEYLATAGDIINNTPIAVLINGGSASASEIVAGALQDHRRAIVIGTQSFGKGSVQKIMPLSQKKAIKLTTARYFTPNGRSIQAQGITPDIIVEPAKVERINQSSSRIAEADLKGHLSNPKEGAATDEKKSGEKKPDKKMGQFDRDNQLYEALNLLKGIAILKEIPASPKADTDDSTDTTQEDMAPAS
ncbi:S41 family peptidase [bacterium]|nr:S41 family peptidase [bacterium]